MSKRRILVVDDTRTSLFLSKKLLEDEGFEVGTASDGWEALDLVAEFQPDLVLLDVMMPGLDGIECCRRIRESEGFSDIRIMMMTALNEADRVQEAFAAGCDDYITKPVDRAELARKVKELLRFLPAM